MERQALLMFDTKTSFLSQNEHEVLKLLLDAGKLLALLYAEQENHGYPGANFYPHDVTRDKIEKAAQVNPELLSPYSVVEEVNGKLVATPYHIKYKNYLDPIISKLLEASKICTDREFSRYLQLQAKALKDGSYEDAEIFWLKMKPHIIDFNIGPVERYDDKLLFVKTSYQCWVGLRAETPTKKAQEFKNVILNAKKQTAMSSEQVDFYDNVRIQVDDLILFSGLIARTVFLGVNLPNDTKLMERYGSEITIFRQSNEYRVKKEVLPAFKKFFSPLFKKTYTSEDIEDGTLYSTILHELGHVYLRYRDSEKRLQDLFPIIDELAAYIVGIKVGGYLLLKDVTTPKQLESIMVAYLARSFEMAIYESDNKSKYHYMIGGVIFINYLFENGAISEKGGVSWPNFTKMFFSLGELASILDKLLSSGSRKDAEEFIERYGDLGKLQRFK